MANDPSHDPASPGRIVPLSQLGEARALVHALDPWTLERQVELTAIPAPPFQEAARGRRMAELFSEIGLNAVHTDEEGNVLGAWTPRRARPPAGPLILSAHLDTVFPAGTDTRPRWEGDTLKAPGITDDGRGLAALLTLARALVDLDLPLPFPLLFVATVGEEGTGNLRGVRHLFREGGAGRGARGFISLDGAGMDRIITRGVGSTRLRLEVKGPGGHSWADWGRPNPIHLLGNVVALAQDLPGETSRRSTLTVARWGGGTSINAIPEGAWIEVDLRSEDPASLTALEQGFRAVVQRCRSPEAREPSAGEGGSREPPAEQGVARGESRRPHPDLELKIRELGRRPPGATPPNDPLVRAALEATRTLEVDPLLGASSTDANVAMSLGIPAITMGAGGSAGGIHTLGEWYRNDEGPEGILRALLTVMLLGD